MTPLQRRAQFWAELQMDQSLPKSVYEEIATHLRGKKPVWVGKSDDYGAENCHNYAICIPDTNTWITASDRLASLLALCKVFNLEVIRKDGLS
jgi:hypothetical protein